MNECKLCGDELDITEDVICGSCVRTFINTEYEKSKRLKKIRQRKVSVCRNNCKKQER